MYLDVEFFQKTKDQINIVIMYLIRSDLSMLLINILIIQIIRYAQIISFQRLRARG